MLRIFILSFPLLCIFPLEKKTQIDSNERSKHAGDTSLLSKMYVMSNYGTLLTCLACLVYEFYFSRHFDHLDTCRDIHSIDKEINRIIKGKHSTFKAGSNHQNQAS